MQQAALLSEPTGKQGYRFPQGSTIFRHEADLNDSCIFVGLVTLLLGLHLLQSEELLTLQLI